MNHNSRFTAEVRLRRLRSDDPYAPSWPHTSRAGLRNVSLDSIDDGGQHATIGRRCEIGARRSAAQHGAVDRGPFPPRAPSPTVRRAPPTVMDCRWRSSPRRCGRWPTGKPWTRSWRALAVKLGD